MMTIRSNIGYPPQGYIYQDPRIPTAKWLDDHTSVDDRTAEIIKFRVANPSVYPELDWTSTAFVRQQVVEYNCARWGNNPRYCIETIPVAGGPAPAIAPRLCPLCGAEITPKFCPTCSGKRITGYECKPCGKEFPL